jgi:hypothetical protein
VGSGRDVPVCAPGPASQTGRQFEGDVCKPHRAMRQLREPLSGGCVCCWCRPSGFASGETSRAAARPRFPLLPLHEPGDVTAPLLIWSPHGNLAESWWSGGEDRDGDSQRIRNLWGIPWSACAPKTSVSLMARKHAFARQHITPITCDEKDRHRSQGIHQVG